MSQVGRSEADAPGGAAFDAIHPTYATDATFASHANTAPDADANPTVTPPATSIQSWIETTARLLATPAVVGDERPLFVAIQRELQGLGVRCTAYADLLVAEGPDPESGVVSAHVDRHGLVCTGPSEFEYAAFVARQAGDAPMDSVSRQMLATVAGRFAGESVIAYEPWSGEPLGIGTITEAHICPIRDNLVFQASGLEHLSPGVPVAYSKPLQLCDTEFAGQLDNVLGVALVLDLFRRGYRGTALFAAQEETGRSWRFIVEYFKRAQRTTRSLVVIDTSPFGDAEAAARQDVVLRNRDATAEFDPEATARVRDAAAALGVRTVFKDEVVEQLNIERTSRGASPRSLGRTELGRVIDATGGAISGTTVQLPTYGYHTSQETVRRDAMVATVSVLERVLALAGASESLQ